MRGVAIREQKVFVVTGLLFETNVVHKTIGPNKVAVPEYFNKVIYDETPPEKMIDSHHAERAEQELLQLLQVLQVR